MFKIFVNNLKLYGYHGVREHEKKDGQYFLFNIEIFIEDSDYSGRDKLENTLSYSDVIREVKRINKSEKYDLLETFSQVLANRIMEMSGIVRKVIIRIEKPSPPINEKLDTVGVEYILDKDDYRPIETRDLKPGSIKNSGTDDLNKAYLSLGSNMGNRKINLKKALKLLENNPSISIESISSLYETEPMYVKDQKSFYNIVVKASIASNMGPFELLGFIKAVEYGLGRKNIGTRYGPRPIDIDILFFGDKIIESEILEIPHPKIVERKFVLLPLSEVTSDIKIGGSDLKMYIKKTHLPEKVKIISSFDIS
ncbi:2-amino-4-hydroxy-6-hydroxymethyldihydropteridine diphosphokinase [Actinomycetota bacterium]